MKYSFVLISLLSIAAFGAEKNSKIPTVTTIPEVNKPLSNTKAEDVTAPSNTTINVIYNNEQAAQTMPPHCTMPAHCAMPPKVEKETPKKDVLSANQPLIINVVGQGVAPVNTTSPAQAYALAKRAATADAYRLIAEKVKGVSVDGQDLIKNMMVKRSTVRTSVQAMVRNANIVETTFKDGLCEVEMEITLSRSDFAQ